MSRAVPSQERSDTHVYFVSARHLKPDLSDSDGSLVKVGHCDVHVGSCANYGLHAVTLRCPRGTLSSMRRQALRSVAREDVLPSVHPRVGEMLELVRLPDEGPFPLMSLEQLLRKGRTNWYEIYEGRAGRISNPRLITQIEAVTTRTNDGEDVSVECLRSGHCCVEGDRFAQFGAFAARNLPPSTVFASYSRGAEIAPVEEVTDALELREFDFEVRLSPETNIVVTGNPLVNSASMINDPKGGGKGPNCEFFVVLAVAMDGTRELHVLFQTIRMVKAGAELLAEYGDAYWKAWMDNRAEMRAMRECALLDLNTWSR